MSLKFALILAVILQFITAIIALSLIRRTRTNIAWWLISLGFVLMAIRRLLEMWNRFDGFITVSEDLISWLGVLISVLMLISLAFIRRIFNIQDRIEKIKAKNEAKIISAIIEAEEKQKQHFSKELHDGLAPLLSSVKMSLTALQGSIVSEKDQKIINNANKLIDESLKTVKDISNTMSPHILQNFGMVQAIKSFIDRLPEENSPKIEIYSNVNAKRYSRTIETVVYRVLTELIANTLKHAHATSVSIKIFENSGKIEIEYFDNGIGCEIKKSTSAMISEKGSGLTNIISRVKSINGNVTFESKPNDGFKANLSIGLNNQPY